jgi:putative ABC transport system ATP-binding protein
MTNLLYQATNLSKTYGTGSGQVDALQGVGLQIDAGEFIAVTGPSGSGKSTLLGLLGLLSTPSSGQLRFCNSELSTLTRNELARLRNQAIGMVFQSYQLLPRCSSLTNVELPLIYAGCAKGERHQRARAALAQVGLEHRLGHHPAQLSGGEQQRVAIARAIVNQPKVILADEPTGALDSETGSGILSLLHKLNQRGTAIVMITHSLEVAAASHRTLELVDGHLQPGPVAVAG